MIAEFLDAPDEKLRPVILRNVANKISFSGVIARDFTL